MVDIRALKWYLIRLAATRIAFLAILAVGLWYLAQ